MTFIFIVQDEAKTTQTKQTQLSDQVEPTSHHVVIMGFLGLKHQVRIDKDGILKYTVCTRKCWKTILLSAPCFYLQNI